MFEILDFINQINDPQMKEFTINELLMDNIRFVNTDINVFEIVCDYIHNVIWKHAIESTKDVYFDADDKYSRFKEEFKWFDITIEEAAFKDTIMAGSKEDINKLLQYRIMRVNYVLDNKNVLVGGESKRSTLTLYDLLMLSLRAFR